MNTTDLDFVEWVRLFTKKTECSDLIEYNQNFYTENSLLAEYLNLKVTEVDVIGYNQNFTINLRRSWYLTLEEVIDYVSKEVIDTAVVMSIKHKNWLDGRDIYIENPAFIKP